MKSNDEINRKIAEFMGLCWHEIKGGTFRPAKCVKDCGLLLSIAEYRQVQDRIHPDYCSDDSPRRLLQEVCSTLLSRGYADGYITALATDHSIDTERWGNAYEGWQRIAVSKADAFLLTHSTAEQISRAIVACIEAGEGGGE